MKKKRTRISRHSCLLNLINLCYINHNLFGWINERLSSTGLLLKKIFIRGWVGYPPYFRIDSNPASPGAFYRVQVGPICIISEKKKKKTRLGGGKIAGDISILSIAS